MSNFTYTATNRALLTAVKHWQRNLLLYLGGSFVIFACFYVFVEIFDDEPFSGYTLFGFIIMYVLTAIVLAYLPFIRRRISLLSSYAEVSKNFAQSNGFDYSATAKPRFDDFHPAIADMGLWAREEQIIGGPYEHYPMRAYIHTFRHPVYSRFTRVATSVYQLSLPKRLPHMFLATRSASGTTFKTNFMRHFDDDQRIQLEGNFSEYFTVYTHRRHRTEALSILAPNVMTTLIDTTQDFNLEIIGDQLFLYTPEYLRDEAQFRQAFKVIDALSKHLDHKLKSWRLVLPNDAKFPFLRSRLSFGTFNLGGKYFNASIIAVGWFGGIQSFRIAVSAVSRQTKIIESVILTAVVFVLIFSLLVFRQKNRSSLRAQ